MKIFARDKGVFPEKENAESLIALFKDLAGTEGDKTLILEKGVYRIDADKCTKELLYPTNTCGDNEWKSGETPHMTTVAIYLKNVNNLTVEGNGAEFVIDGVATNLVMESCDNITFKNIKINVINPNLHEFKVVGKGAFYMDLELDGESEYETSDGGYDFIGKGYRYPFKKGLAYSHWNGYIPADNPNSIWRVAHPFAGAIKIKQLGKRLFRAYYLLKKKGDVGARYYVFDARRNNNGIFISNCKNVSLSGIEQNFNYALAVVAQNCRNLTIEKSRFAPDVNSAKKIASLADFIQVCMCSGDVIIKDNYFEGAGDDCLNVHGVHFAVKNIDENKITVRFMHKQSHGYNPIEAGDRIEYVDRDDMLAKGGALIKSSVMLNEYEIELTVDNTEGLKTGMVVEDVTKCPNLLFENNYMTRIITRGILVTTSGKVVIRKNNFDNTTMNSILFSDDAKNWYESGRVLDAIIEDNIFGRCPEWTVCIKPENSVHNGFVHGKFLIRNNLINSVRGGLYAKSTECVIMENNKFAAAEYPKKIKNCGNVEIK